MCTTLTAPGGRGGRQMDGGGLREPGYHYTK